jgi:succinyl-diaminopimelate desuccinylase
MPVTRPRVDHSGLIAFAQELVRIRSVNDSTTGTTEAEASMFVADKMRSFGWDPMVEEIEPGRFNVVAVLDGGLPGKTLMFEGHADVVTEGDRDEWSFDPYGGDIVEGRLLGRGSADMKSGVAAMLFAARAIVDAGTFPGRIVVGVLCDEEGLMIGAKAFAASDLAGDVDGAFVCEPEAGEVCTTQKGALRLRIEATGKMAHGAMPHQGLNPIVALGRLQRDISVLESQLQATHGEHPHLGLPYVTPTVFQAGSVVQMNVIPREALMTLDIRTLPGIDHGQIREDITRLAASVMGDTGVRFTVETIDDRPPTSTSEDHPVVQAIVAAHEEVLGETPPLGGVPGTTDGTILWRDAGIPVVVYGPGGKWIAHQADEFVEVEDMTRHADVYVAAALNFLGSD